MTDAVASPCGVQVVRSPYFSPAMRSNSTDGRIIYAIGDIHGCYALLSRLLEAVVADIRAISSSARPLLVFCGDYVDRGPQSSGVLAALVWLSRHAPLEVVFLRGNHEAMLLDFLDQPDRCLPWLSRDGGQTLRSYGVEMPDDTAGASAEDCFRLRDELADRMPASHIELLHRLPVLKSCGDYLFVHAGLRPGVPIARQEDDDCLWIGEEFRASDYRFQKIIVHGHSWNSDAPQITPNRIGIDTGAYSTGVLTAVRLEASSIEFIQARAAANASWRRSPGHGQGGN